MKIAMFTDTYEPQKNGVVTSIKIFTKYLRKMGHEVHIFCPESPGFRQSSNVHTFKSMRFVKYPEYRIGVPHYLPILKKRFDIVHVHTPASLGLFGILFANYHKIPTIGHFHTLLPEYTHYITKRAKNLTKRSMWNFLSLFYNRCDCVIAPSNHIKKLLEKRIKSKVYVIPTPIEFKNKFKNKAKLRKKYKRKYNLFEKDKILLHVGRITKEKNITSIIHALKKIRSKNIKLIISSDGPYKEELEKKVRNMKNIIFTGYLSDDKLDDIYSLSDGFVFASKTETQGIVLLEAVNNRLPIVALDAPVISDFIAENKIGLVAMSTDDFARKISELLKNKELRKNLMKNRDKVVAEYGPRRCDELVNLYLSLSKARK